MFLILYDSAVKKDIKKISKPAGERIKRAIELKLAENPQDFAGHLKGELGNYWKLRVGDYRVVFKIQGSRTIILAIMHRKEIYKRIINRDL